MTHDTRSCVLSVSVRNRHKENIGELKAIIDFLKFKEFDNGYEINSHEHAGYERSKKRMESQGL